MKFKNTLLQCCLLSGMLTISAQPQSAPAGNNFVAVAMMNSVLLLFATIFIWAPATQAQSTPSAAVAKSTRVALQARISRVERGLSTPVVVKGAPGQKMMLTERMAFYQVPAVSIALINNGKIEWAHAYGLADTSSQRAATVKTMFQAGSIGKAVSAIGALRLVEQGKLSLDEDANRQLASWKIPQNEFTRDRAVTLCMLLNHSAGTTVHGFDGYAQGQKLPTLLQVLDGAAPANSEPIRVDHIPG